MSHVPDDERSGPAEPPRPRLILIERQMQRFLRGPVTVRSAASVIVTSTIFVVVISGVLRKSWTTASTPTSSSACGGRCRPSRRSATATSPQRTWPGGSSPPRSCSRRSPSPAIVTAAVTSAFVERASKQQNAIEAEDRESEEAREQARFDEINGRLDRLETMLRELRQPLNLPGDGSPGQEDATRGREAVRRRSREPIERSTPMCRWLAYTGSPLTMVDLLLKPKHSLIDQSLHSTMGAEPTNGDGFGIGWYGLGETPGVFHSVEPAWNDRNLRNLAAHISSPMVFAHIRASSGSAIQQTNCHPFRHGRWLWMHNGLIGEFHQLKREIVLAVDPSLYPEIEGSTDSEVFFHLALSMGLEDDPPGAVQRAVGLIEQIGARHGVDQPMQMTVATTDGTTLWVFRYSSAHRRGRSSTRTTSPPCVSSTLTPQSCSRCRMSPGWSCRSRSATSPAPGRRCRNRPTA